MSQPSEQMVHVPDTAASCGRSWEALVDRRRAAFIQAQALVQTNDQNSNQVVSEFLEFFDNTGVGLFRDEEEWIFRSLRPTPRAVLRALEEHIQISSLITALIREAQAGCTDLRVVHKLGSLLETHLLTEEENVGSLFRSRPGLTLA